MPTASGPERRQRNDVCCTDPQKSGWHATPAPRKQNSNSHARRIRPSSFIHQAGQRTHRNATELCIDNLPGRQPNSKTLIVACRTERQNLECINSEFMLHGSADPKFVQHRCMVNEPNFPASVPLASDCTVTALEAEMHIAKHLKNKSISSRLEFTEKDHAAQSCAALTGPSRKLYQRNLPPRPYFSHKDW